MLKSLSLATKFLLRELRAGEWFIIFFALWLAISAVTGLHFYTDRLQRGIEHLSKRLLGGDLVVSSSSPIPAAWLQQASKNNLHTSQVWTYPSVVTANNKLQLVSIQAMESNYPLIGEPITNLAVNTVLVDSRLLNALNVKLHDKVTIGSASFDINGYLPKELDVANTGWLIAPRVLMRLSDVPSTNTVLPGSRVDYRLILAGDAVKIQSFQSWLRPQLTPGQNFIDINNQRVPIRETVDRANQYIQLVLLACLLMSGIVIALSIRQYLTRHFDYVALWRCLGAQAQQIKAIFIWQLLIIAILAGCFGITTGFILQNIIANLLDPFVQIPLPAASYQPALLGFVTSIFLLFAYAYPLITELPQTSPLFIWRNEIIVPSTRLNYLYITLGVLLLYLYWAMDFSLLVLFFVDALLLSIGFIYAINIFLLALLKKISMRSEGAIRRGFSQLIQHPDSTVMQMTAFSLIIMMLFVLANVRDDILRNWQQSLPAQTPNYFAFNIAPTDVSAFEAFLKTNQVNFEQLYPIVRGRITELNNKPILQAVPASARGHNSLHRELNLSWSLAFPSDNKIVAGTAWDATAKGKSITSVEKSLADALHLRIGDEVTFQIGANKFHVTIDNIRTVEWGSFHPNFYFIFPPGVAEEFPTTYLTSFHLAPMQTNLLNNLVQQFPNVTVIDVANALQQIQGIVVKLTTAISYLFYFAVGLAGLIFITSLQASMDERRETYTLLRVLGASRAYIVKSLLVEFLCLGVFVLMFGFVLAKIIAYLLITNVFPH